VLPGVPRAMLGSTEPAGKCPSSPAAPRRSTFGSQLPGMPLPLTPRRALHAPHVAPLVVEGQQVLRLEQARERGRARDGGPDDAVGRRQVVEQPRRLLRVRRRHCHVQNAPWKVSHHWVSSVERLKHKHVVLCAMAAFQCYKAGRGP